MDPARWQRKKDRFDRRMERLERRWERNRWGGPGRHLFSGMVFVTVGVVFLLGNMGFLNLSYVLRFWPILLIAAGIFKLVESGDNYAHSSGIFWIVVGGLFLTGTLGILDVSFRDFWPVLLIGFGALMLWRSSLISRERRSVSYSTGSESSPGFAGFEPSAAKVGPEGSTAASSNSIISAMAILGAVERRNNSQDFRGGSVTAIMGGCDIDLRPASIASPAEPVLEVFALWGGIEVKVPADWTVVSYVDPILGGYEDSTQPPKEGSKRIVIRGTAIMGGIEVSN